jgi:enoyl-CoA hydratase
MEKIRYELAGGIAQITLDDGKANAMSGPFFAELESLLDRAQADGARVVLFAGRQGMFSGGLDVKLLPTLSPDGLRELSAKFARTMLRIYQLRIPTIAACTGHAIAGGAVLAFACDRRFAVAGPFRIQMNEVAIGIALPSWMLLIGASAIPLRWQTSVLLHARPMTPAEAFERGVVDGLVEAGGDVVAHARSSAEDLLLLNGDAYAASKRRLRGPGVTRVLELLDEELPG